MHTFSISNLDGIHLGFLLLQMEKEDSKKGLLIFKIQASEQEYYTLPEYQALLELPLQQSLVWQQKNELIEIYDNDNLRLAKINGAYLSFRTYTYVLDDLTGNF